MVLVSKSFLIPLSGLTYATVGTVGSSALLGGLVDLDVLDNEVGGVETLGVGVGLGVLQEAEQELSGLGGPAGAGDAELLACVGGSISVSTSSPCNTNWGAGGVVVKKNHPRSWVTTLELPL